MANRRTWPKYESMNVLDFDGSLRAVGASDDHGPVVKVQRGVLGLVDPTTSIQPEPQL